jgi:uncharacterized protein (DUF1697 family)
MTTHIALLRGINVGGHKQVAMADLRALVARSGFSDVQSLLQTGNLLFSSQGKSPAQLERMLRDTFAAKLDLECEVFVRTAAEWRQIVAHNPFPEHAKSDPARLMMICLKEAPGAASMKALQAAIVGREQVRANGRHAYAIYPDGMGTSKLSLAVIEKTLGTRGTARNWNTVLKVAALADA